MSIRWSIPTNHGRQVVPGPVNRLRTNGIPGGITVNSRDLARELSGFKYEAFGEVNEFKGILAAHSPKFAALVSAS